MLWWGSEVRKGLKPYYKALASIIVWELWKRRNQRLIHNVVRSMHMLLKLRRPNKNFSGNWPGMLKELEEFNPEVVTKVLWEFPPPGWMIYDTDGASRGNPWVSSYVFCLRDTNVDLLYAEGTTLDNTTNTLAKAKAILEASKNCKQTQYNNIIIQTASLLLKKVLEGEWACPWTLADIVADIKSNLQGNKSRIQHILREGNQLADYLANLGIDIGNCRYLHFHNMKSTGKRIINSD